MLESHWREARDTDDEEGRFAIGFKVSVNVVRVRRRQRVGGLLNYYTARQHERPADLLHHTGFKCRRRGLQPETDLDIEEAATASSALLYRKTPRDRRRFGRRRMRSPEGETAGRGGRIKPGTSQRAASVGLDVEIEPPPEDWWRGEDEAEWQAPELPLDDGQVLVLDAGDPFPAEEWPVYRAD